MLLSLPNEILVLILSPLHFKDLVVCRSASHLPEPCTVLPVDSQTGLPYHQLSGFRLYSSSVQTHAGRVWPMRQ